jgi:hypothetical protein
MKATNTYQNHSSECRRAESVSNSEATGRPHRSVSALLRMKTIFLPSARVSPALAAVGLLAAILSLQAQPDRPASAGRPADAKYALEQPPSAAAPGADLFADGKKRIIFRLDDAGLCHAVNAALERILKDGTASAVGVMVNTPWLDEAVAILKRHPEVSVGLHTTLNCEWTPYRCGPVLPAKEVPSLVDEWGKFFGTRKELVAHQPNPDEAEREFRAQVDLALRKGLKLSYMDHHMSGPVTTLELKARFEKVARDYGLAVPRWFGERPGPVIYDIAPEKKADFLLAGLRRIDQPGLYLVVCHIGIDTPSWPRSAISTPAPPPRCPGTARRRPTCSAIPGSGPR